MPEGHSFPAHFDLALCNKHEIEKRFFSENLVQIDISISNRSADIWDSSHLATFDPPLDAPRTFPTHLGLGECDTPTTVSHAFCELWVNPVWVVKGLMLPRRLEFLDVFRGLSFYFSLGNSAEVCKSISVWCKCHTFCARESKMLASLLFHWIKMPPLNLGEQF